MVKVFLDGFCSSELPQTRLVYQPTLVLTVEDLHLFEFQLFCHAKQNGSFSWMSWIFTLIFWEMKGIGKVRYLKYKDNIVELGTRAQDLELMTQLCY